MSDKTLEERVEWLEKRYDRMYHTYELLNIYIPKLVRVLEKFWPTFSRWRGAMEGDAKYTRELAKETHKKAIEDVYE